MRGNFENLPSTCGIGLFNHFSTYGDFPLKDRTGGANWVIAGFINTKTCREAYQELCKNYTLVWQSPVRTNSRSGNRFFFCIFDRKN